MTTQLRDAFTDLAAGVASHVVTEDLGRTAWARGRRRRIRQRLAAAAIALSVVAVITALLLPVVGSPRSVSPGQESTDATVKGYPQRIANQWSIDDLPARPGPLAAVMKTAIEHPTHDEFDSWYGLTETGRRWRLNVGGVYDDIYPTISQNGRYLGYLAADAGPYVIHDVVTGEKVVFRQVGMGERGTSYFVRDPTAQLLVVGWFACGYVRDDEATSTSGALVLGTDGSFAFVEGAADTFLAGWANDDALIWLGWPWSQGELRPDTEVTAHVRQIDGTVLSSIQLRPTEPWQGRFSGQWTGTGSADGREILVLEDVGLGTVVHRFSMTTGAESAQPASVSDYSEPCAAVWVGSDVAVPVIDSTSDASNATTALLRAGGVQAVTVIEPGVGSRCIVWATDALAGEAHGGLWGMSTSWLSWNWRETIVVTLLSVAAVWMVLRLTRPYRMRHPGRASSQV